MIPERSLLKKAQRHALRPDVLFQTTTNMNMFKEAKQRTFQKTTVEKNEKQLFQTVFCCSIIFLKQFSLCFCRK